MENWVQNKKDAPGTNPSLQIFRYLFMEFLNETVFEWSGAIFHCINQVNSERAVTTG